MTDSLPPLYGTWVHNCHKLIKNFSYATSGIGSSFREFEGHWKCLNFELMFREHSTEELTTLISELYNVGKYFLFSQPPLASRIGGLYLLYALYFTQPTRNKIRFTLSELKELVAFLDELKQGNMDEPQFTLYKLFVENACLFAATPSQFVGQKHQSEENVDVGNLQTSWKCGLLVSHGLSFFELNNLEEKLKKYQEIKSQIPGFCTSNSKSAVDGDFVSEFH